MMNLFKSKKGFQTKTGILVVLVLFYTTLFVLIGYINSYFNIQSGVQTEDINTTGFFGFIQNVISGISDIPWWLNTILFVSLIVIGSWIIFSSLPTFNGGS